MGADIGAAAGAGGVSAFAGGSGVGFDSDAVSNANKAFSRKSSSSSTTGAVSLEGALVNGLVASAAGIAEFKPTLS